MFELMYTEINIMIHKIPAKISIDRWQKFALNKRLTFAQ